MKPFSWPNSSDSNRFLVDSGRSLPPGTFQKSEAIDCELRRANQFFAGAGFRRGLIPLNSTTRADFQDHLLEPPSIFGEAEMISTSIDRERAKRRRLNRRHQTFAIEGLFCR